MTKNELLQKIIQLAEDVENFRASVDTGAFALGAIKSKFLNDFPIRLSEIEKELSPDNYKSVEEWEDVLSAIGLRPIVHWLDSRGLNLSDEIISMRMQSKPIYPPTPGVDSDFDETFKEYLAKKYNDKLQNEDVDLDINRNVCITGDSKSYWPSAIIQNDGESKPWLCAMTTSQSNLDDAKLIIERLKTNHNVLSAWIDTFDENGVKTTIFHECYI